MMRFRLDVLEAELGRDSAEALMESAAAKQARAAAARAESEASELRRMVVAMRARDATLQREVVRLTLVRIQVHVHRS